VGDNDDLKRIFGLENATDVNKEQVRERQTRDIERKLVTNIKRRPTTSIGYGIKNLYYLTTILSF
jgi:hypothetical protein